MYKNRNNKAFFYDAFACRQRRRVLVASGLRRDTVGDSHHQYPNHPNIQGTTQRM